MGTQEFQTMAISIHAPRTGSDAAYAVYLPKKGHFNPRSPHGERQPCGCHIHVGQAISIHAPRTGSDQHRHFVP